MEPSAEADQCGGGSVDGTDPGQRATPAAQRPGAGQMPDRLLHQGAQAGLVAVVGAFSVGQSILGPPVPDLGMPVLAGRGQPAKAPINQGGACVTSSPQRSQTTPAVRARGSYRASRRHTTADRRGLLRWL